ncbi:hypothetical protein AKJ65_02275 [candidate division MSBL1 archaeon SCGC-AAA259E19]|uniref:Uncharacterized protein n=1 Tax=candidate division MSBL1 archaeon SCGC-AAA259E19 TaxID=1698264 RepID=A0A133ULU7_9EURY|nr:hypothetical protein AKJ65_02275 [candidate division MSBL1 archaeon SCGC-AAA259E19]
MKKAPVFTSFFPTKTQSSAGVSPTSRLIYSHFKANYLKDKTNLNPSHTRFKAGLIPKKRLREVNPDHDRECLKMRVRSGRPPGRGRELQAEIGFLPAGDSVLDRLTLFLNWRNEIHRLVKDPVYTSSKPAANWGSTGGGRS